MNDYPQPPTDVTAPSLWQRIFRYFAEPLRRANDEQREFVNSPLGRRIDWKVIVVLLSVAVLMTVQEYGFGKLLDRPILDLCDQLFPPENVSGRSIDNWVFSQHVEWGLRQLLVYIVVPVLLIKLVLRERLADYGLKLRGMFSAWPLYLLMMGVMFPVVLFASTQPGFLETYPFYRPAPHVPLWPRFFAWEVVYICQFIGLEFFFRGFMLHALRPRFGAYSILVMTIPYCMIHFQKPMLETFAAILAGAILGFMSLKTRSIWLGAALHVGVALTMDTLALSKMR